MSKTWATKKRILNLLSKRSMMPSEISKALNLSPSTVTEHLKILKQMGAIKESQNPYIKKWKYYEINNNFDVKKFEKGNMMAKKMDYIISAIVAIIIVAGAVFFLSSSSNNSNSNGQPTTTLPQSVLQTLNTSRLSIQLTDPPTVPSGTTSLVINYSDVSAHLSSGTNSSGWVNGTGSGSINLLSIVNTSQILGNVTLVKNATINMVRFYISNAWITINNTKYNVTVPSGMITAHITSGNRLGATSSAILDLSPVIATIYTNNSTIFVMVPSVRAIVVPTQTINLHSGLKVGFSSNITDQLNEIRPNITIRSVNLIVNTNNSTSIVVSVENKGNSNVTLNNIQIFGNESIIIKPRTQVDLSNESTHSNESSNVISTDRTTVINATGNMPYQFNTLKTQLKARSDIISNNTISGNMLVTQNTHVNSNSITNAANSIISILGNALNSSSINVSAVAHEHPYLHGLGLDINGSIVNLKDVIGEISNRASINSELEIGTHLSNFRTINFFIGSSGQLLLPFANKCAANSSITTNATQNASSSNDNTDTQDKAEGYCLNNKYSIDGQQKGYTIPAKSSATFIFSGKISMGNGVVTVMPVAGNVYTIKVTGENGADASTNVTASGV